jgi:hypothetical protein
MVPVRMIAGPRHKPHEIGPVLSDFLGGEPGLKWQIFERTAHEDHGDAPFVLVVGTVGKLRTALIKQLDDHRQRAGPIRPQPNERPTDSRKHAILQPSGLDAHILL